MQGCLLVTAFVDRRGEYEIGRGHFPINAKAALVGAMYSIDDVLAGDVSEVEGYPSELSDGDGALSGFPFNRRWMCHGEARR